LRKVKRRGAGVLWQNKNVMEKKKRGQRSKKRFSGYRLLSWSAKTKNWAHRADCPYDKKAVRKGNREGPKERATSTSHSGDKEEWGKIIP